MIHHIEVNAKGKVYACTGEVCDTSEADLIKARGPIAAVASDGALFCMGAVTL